MQGWHFPCSFVGRHLYRACFMQTWHLLLCGRSSAVLPVPQPVLSHRPGRASGGNWASSLFSVTEPLNLDGSCLPFLYSLTANFSDLKSLKPSTTMVRRDCF